VVPARRFHAGISDFLSLSIKPSSSSSIRFDHPLSSRLSPTMAYPRATIRPKRKSSSASIMSKLTLFAFVLVAIICFLPVGSQVQAQDDKADYGTVIGIDLGTTYSCVA